MKTASKLACILLLVSAAVLPALANNNQYIYVRSNVGQPWGQATNEAAMDSVFGPGKWTTMYYEEISVGDLLNSDTLFIFLEGGDSSFQPFSDFINNHGNPLSNWVSRGGRLLIMAAPNDPLNSADLVLPDNVLMHADAFYGSAASAASAVDMYHPIFTGPNPTTSSFTGDFFAHGYFMGPNTQSLMQNNLYEMVLGKNPLGSGVMMVGALTTDNFQVPQMEAHGLLMNIIYYTANVFLGQ